MQATIAQILEPYESKPELAERIAHRAVKPSIAIVAPNPAWPQRFEQTKARIEQALGPVVVDIAHVGSTSVPGLAAKDIIDIDLTVTEIQDEASYVKPLEEAGFRFLLREPQWRQHRFFVADGAEHHVNLHVWGPGCPEVVRHRIFRDWLRKTPADVELYAEAKRRAAEQTAAGRSMEAYTQLKDQTVQEILGRAFRDLGYIE